MLVDGIHHPVLPAAFVARAKGVFLLTVYRAVKRGDLHGYQVESSWLVINDAALDAWQPPALGRPRKKRRKARRPRTAPAEENEETARRREIADSQGH